MYIVSKYRHLTDGAQDYSKYRHLTDGAQDYSKYRHLTDGAQDYNNCVSANVRLSSHGD